MATNVIKTQSGKLVVEDTIRKMMEQMPTPVQRDLQRALEILKRHGAKRIILYGSYARGTATPTSDIDLCEDGVPDTDYFRVWAECLMTVNSRISILDLASVKGYLRERILREGKVLYVAG